MKRAASSVPTILCCIFTQEKGVRIACTSIAKSVIKGGSEVRSCCCMDINIDVDEDKNVDVDISLVVDEDEDENVDFNIGDPGKLLINMYNLKV